MLFRHSSLSKSEAKPHRKALSLDPVGAPSSLGSFGHNMAYLMEEYFFSLQNKTKLLLTGDYTLI